MRIFIIALLLAISYAQTATGTVTIEGPWKVSVLNTYKPDMEKIMADMLGLDASAVKSTVSGTDGNARVDFAVTGDVSVISQISESNFANNFIHKIIDEGPSALSTMMSSSSSRTVVTGSYTLYGNRDLATMQGWSSQLRSLFAAELGIDASSVSVQMSEEAVGRIKIVLTATGNLQQLSPMKDEKTFMIGFSKRIEDANSELYAALGFGGSASVKWSLSGDWNYAYVESQKDELLGYFAAAAGISKSDVTISVRQVGNQVEIDFIATGTTAQIQAINSKNFAITFKNAVRAGNEEIYDHLYTTIATGSGEYEMRIAGGNLRIIQGYESQLISDFAQISGILESDISVSITQKGYYVVIDFKYSGTKEQIDAINEKEIATDLYNLIYACNRNLAVVLKITEKESESSSSSSSDSDDDDYHRRLMKPYRYTSDSDDDSDDDDDDNDHTRVMKPYTCHRYTQKSNAGSKTLKSMYSVLPRISAAFQRLVILAFAIIGMMSLLHLGYRFATSTKYAAISAIEEV